jgi:hypothetical protein
LGWVGIKSAVSHPQERGGVLEHHSRPGSFDALFFKDTHVELCVFPRRQGTVKSLFFAMVLPRDRERLVARLLSRARNEGVSKDRRENG